MVFQKGNTIGEKNWFKKVKKISIECPNCLKVTLKYPSSIKRGEKYCSRSCFKEHHKFKGRPQKNSKSVCSECLTEFYHKSYEKRMYCSLSCAGKNKNNKKGENNPSWKGGVTPIIKRIRNSKDYSIWRKAIYERDDYTCQICGSKNDFLNAHHIKPISEDITRALDLDNGLTLCVVCHQNQHPDINLNISQSKKNGGSL